MIIITLTCLNHNLTTALIIIKHTVYGWGQSFNIDKRHRTTLKEAWREPYLNFTNLLINDFIQKQYFFRVELGVLCSEANSIRSMYIKFSNTYSCVLFSDANKRWFTLSNPFSSMIWHRSNHLRLTLSANSWYSGSECKLKRPSRFRIWHNLRKFFLASRVIGWRVYGFVGFGLLRTYSCKLRISNQ